MLLLHWSTLNVTGLSKILKKHDKVSKGHTQLRASYLANALQQVPPAARPHSIIAPAQCRATLWIDKLP